jgi:hypothetical protein
MNSVLRQLEAPRVSQVFQPQLGSRGSTKCHQLASLGLVRLREHCEVRLVRNDEQCGTPKIQMVYNLIFLGIEMN